MLFTLLFTCVVLMAVCNAGWFWGQPASPWRSGYSILAAITLILFVIWLLIQFKIIA